jgi:hypothetical protein
MITEQPTYQNVHRHVISTKCINTAMCFRVGFISRDSWLPNFPPTITEESSALCAPLIAGYGDGGVGCAPGKPYKRRTDILLA